MYQNLFDSHCCIVDFVIENPGLFFYISISASLYIYYPSSYSFICIFCVHIIYYTILYSTTNIKHVHY